MTSVTQQAKRQIKMSSGTLPDPKIACLAASHPFTQQVDVVFPSTFRLLEALQKLETIYWKGKIKLSDIVNDGFSSTTGESKVLLVSHSRHEDDVWCVDPRARLTICASKESYERIGLVGKKLPFKNRSECRLIDISLGENLSSPKNLDKIKTAIQRWDEQRRSESANREFWDVLYCLRDPNALDSPQFPFQAREQQLRKVQCTKREMKNVHIPCISSYDLSSSDNFSENYDAASIFEWVGMACLGAQRLNMNDRVESFVAVYDPPFPANAGDITHLQWKGLLPPGFVQRILDTIINNIDSASFVGLVSHALTSSPVSYIPSRQAESGHIYYPTSACAPFKLPQEDGEDTWSLLLERPLNFTSTKDVKWCLTESR